MNKRLFTKKSDAREKMDIYNIERKHTMGENRKVLKCAVYAVLKKKYHPEGTPLYQVEGVISIIIYIYIYMINKDDAVKSVLKIMRETLSCILRKYWYYLFTVSSEKPYRVKIRKKTPNPCDNSLPNRKEILKGAILAVLKKSNGVEIARLESNPTVIKAMRGFSGSSLETTIKINFKIFFEIERTYPFRVKTRWQLDQPLSVINHEMIAKRLFRDAIFKILNKKKQNVEGLKLEELEKSIKESILMYWGDVFQVSPDPPYWVRIRTTHITVPSYHKLAQQQMSYLRDLLFNFVEQYEDSRGPPLAELEKDERIKSLRMSNNCSLRHILKNKYTYIFTVDNHNPHRVQIREKYKNHNSSLKRY
eukprot:GHVL01016120.1.p1 GENE.GHVL01016120.1~~GHVL01016120.1.p1  ORF type:complete len:363 (+),score=44.17 GHVL01016120.1:48-1136(+)